MGDYNRIIALFGYETDGGTNSILWSNPYYFPRATGQSGQMLDEAMNEWKQTKRPLTKEEVVQGHWIKEADGGNSFFTKLFPDGTLVEYLLGNPTNVWQGTWQLVGVALRLNIGKYELDILANKEGQIHSGIEAVNDRLYPQTYFRCTHVISETTQ